MIVVNFEGGLGNQMFQYAAAFALANTLETELKCTVDLLASHRTKRTYELRDVFGVEVDVASPRELSMLLGPLCTNKQVRRFLAKPPAAFLRSKKFISDDYLIFVDNLADRCIAGGYLHGFWQSEEYFEGSKHTIRSCFTFPAFENDTDQSIVSEMKDCYSIGVHVRRGDYLTSAKTNSLHNVLPLSYYRSAINRLAKEQPYTKLFVFSDDPEWAEQHIEPLSEHTHIISHNQGNSAFRDMQLLSLCDAVVMANSSFSWWAAWLNNKITKRIIAPKKWFSSERTSSNHIVPARWELLE